MLHWFIFIESKPKIALKWTMTGVNLMSGAKGLQGWRKVIEGSDGMRGTGASEAKSVADWLPFLWCGFPHWVRHDSFSLLDPWPMPSIQTVGA